MGGTALQPTWHETVLHKPLGMKRCCTSHITYYYRAGHAALSDQGNHPYILNGIYCLKDRGGQVGSVYHTSEKMRPAMQLYQIRATTSHTYCMVFTA